MKSYTALIAAFCTTIAFTAAHGPALAADAPCAPAPHANLTPSETSDGAVFVPFVHLMGRVEEASSFSLDKLGTPYTHNTALNTTLRVGMTTHSGKRLAPLFTRFEYEHDMLAGVVVGGTTDRGLTHGPNSERVQKSRIRRAFVTVAAGTYVVLGAGVTMSQWGLGLIANDGNQFAGPGSASFTDPRGGDSVLRLLLASGTDAFKVFVAADKVLQDDVLLQGDKARQVVAGLTYTHKTSLEAGIYGVMRQQDTRDAKRTDVMVLDAYAKWNMALSPFLRLKVEGETALITGTTDLGPNPQFPSHEVLQMAGALRVSLDANYFGGVIDVLYATGDRDFEDGQQNAFKADINYEMGLLLFRHVLAAQSARFPSTATDADLSGYPSEDLDRLPTRGSVTNTLSIFPRVWWRPSAGVELYGGTLIAFSAVDTSDPLNTKLAGGENRNPYDAKPGSYLGTEFDLGMRYRTLISGTEFNLGLEGAVLLPGSAFAQPSDATLAPIYGGRFLINTLF